MLSSIERILSPFTEVDVHVVGRIGCAFLHQSTLQKNGRLRGISGVCCARVANTNRKRFHSRVDTASTLGKYDVQWDSRIRSVTKSRSVTSWLTTSLRGTIYIRFVRELEKLAV